MENAFNNKMANPFQQHLDFPSFDHANGNNHEESSLGLIELSLNLRNQLNSLKSIKKNFSRRFDSLLLSSEKKDPAKEDVNYEQKYRELLLKYGELEDIHQEQIEEAKQKLGEANQENEKRIKNFEDQLQQKDRMIDLMKQGHIQTQEKVNLLESRIASLEQLNTTLTTQLKEKSRELVGTIEGINSSMTSRSRDVVNMKVVQTILINCNSRQGDFSRLVERLGNLEDIIKNLREGKKQDVKTLEELTKKYEDLKSENFQLLMENTKLKNELEETKNKFSSMDKCFLERRQKTDEFINTLTGYQNSFQMINQVNLDLERVFQPLKDQNARLLQEKEKLSEENRNMKLRIAALEESKDKAMEEEKVQAEGNENAEKPEQEWAKKGIDQKFYVEVMEKFKEFEKQLEGKEKENNELQSELDELKKQNFELNAKIISLNRSPSRRENNEQYLTVETDAYNMKSPRRRKGDEAPENSENKRGGDVDKDNKESERDSARDNQEAMEEDEKDARLKITKKQKPVKKNPTTFNLLTTITICPNCSLIIKKTEKNMKECSKCHSFMHEKCADEKSHDGLCTGCQKKFKKTPQVNNEEEAADNEEDKSKQGSNVEGEGNK